MGFNEDWTFMHMLKHLSCGSAMESTCGDTESGHHAIITVGVLFECCG